MIFGNSGVSEEFVGVSGTLLYTYISVGESSLTNGDLRHAGPHSGQ